MKELQSLFDRTYQLEQELLVLQEDLKELRGEFTYHKEFNTDGHGKETVVQVMKAAKARAKQDDLAAKAEEYKRLQELQDLYSN